MKFTTPENLSYCGKLVHGQRREWFWLSLYAPAAAREALYALYALDIELSHIHHVVSEEMIVHIRYAWWQEGVEALNTGVAPRAHPVFDALREQQLPPALLLPVVLAYREVFPEMPQDIEAVVQHSAAEIIAARAPEALKRWKKAVNIIQNHRGKSTNWLLIKLLFC